MFDEDLPLKKSDDGFAPRNLENMSVTELQEYIREMKAEIARVEADIEQKQASQNAAAAVFKS